GHKAAQSQNGTGRNTDEVQRLAAEAKEALGGYYREFLSPETRNARSVWTVAPTPYRGAHFAPMPEALARRCVLAASRPGDLVLDPF
ncbi:site-specific DNA-methyltransferase, partial [Escherichia coli]|nr:site-specific DNA-methyltransferase [Escherichia coli]